MKALSIRQPHAEAIRGGVKKVEYRSRPTNVRGRIYIYATLGRYKAGEEARMMAEYRIDDVDIDELLRGVIVGPANCTNATAGIGTSVIVIELTNC